MGKIRTGNKKNSFLNGEWADHVQRSMKKITSGKRRAEDRKLLKKELEAAVSPHAYTM